jgi:hypothetical protein
MHLLALASMARWASYILAWARQFLSRHISRPRPQHRWSHMKLDIGRGWFRYEIESSSRPEPVGPSSPHMERSMMRPKLLRGNNRVR